MRKSPKFSPEVIERAVRKHVQGLSCAPGVGPRGNFRLTGGSEIARGAKGHPCRGLPRGGGLGRLSGANA
jgi:hypothetical protein